MALSFHLLVLLASFFCLSPCLAGSVFLFLLLLPAKQSRSHRQEQKPKGKPDPSLQAGPNFSRFGPRIGLARLVLDSSICLIMSLEPKKSGGPVHKFWDSGEILTSLESVKGWMCKNAKKVKAKESDPGSSLAQSCGSLSACRL